MSPVLYSLLAVALAFIVIAIWAFREGNEGWQVVSIILPICIGIFGFGMFGTINTWKTTEESCKVHEVLKGKHIIVVCTDKENVIFKDYEIENMTDSTSFYWEVSINHYNCESGRVLKYK